MRPSRLNYSSLETFGINRGDRTRTCGLKVPNFARYQLCYTPLLFYYTGLRGGSQPACFRLDFFHLRQYYKWHERHAGTD